MSGPIITTDAKERKNVPLARGLFDYFPAALVAVAALSAKGNTQHHEDKPIHWDRSKSNDHADALLRHLLDRGTKDTDGVLHSAKVAWRALAILQEELERLGVAPPARGALLGPEDSGRNYNDVIADAINAYGRGQA